jgi:signal transduction histidine kinase/DNA-binding response OmpR family regulator
MPGPLHQSYNATLVTLSVVIAMLAAYTALDLAGRIFAGKGQGRLLWIAGGATAMGVGIWSMHFVGMLALQLPLAIIYGFSNLVASFAVAIVASGFAMWMIGRDDVRMVTLAAAAVAMGAGIAGMHYIGMAGMEMRAILVYDTALWWASIAIAILASFVALYMARRLRATETARVRLIRIGAAVVMGCAIAGMHYTGMAAASFLPMPSMNTSAPSGLPSFILGLLVGLGGILIVGLALIASMLDRLVRSRTIEATLRAEKEAAERTNRMKSEFLSTMSHELRTPLNSIIGFANILRKNRANNLLDGDIKYLARISANGAHLLGLINEVLDLSKIEAGRMELQVASVDLAALARDTMSEMEPQAAGRHVRLVTVLPPGLAPLATDPSRLRQILINLLGNAIKFTDHGTVTLRVTADAETNRPVRIDVEDSGIGIPADRVQSVFEAFQQADATTAREYGGTGLGLTITRSLAQLLGWEIHVSSELGVGSVFSIDLEPASGVARPVVAPPAAVSSARISKPTQSLANILTAGPGPTRVLIIDDESDSRMILQSQLEELGCEVYAATSADEGITMARQLVPQLITLDVMMPRKNGWEALRELKADVDLRDIPVVIVSIVASDKRGRFLGAVDCIDKPVTRDALAHVIRRNVHGAMKPCVLLVQDGQTNIHRYREIASVDGIVLEVVTGIEEASNALSTHKAPDLVVLDVSSWDAEVTTWVSRLRDQLQVMGVPVVVVVSDALIDSEKESLTFGVSIVQRGDDLGSDFAGMMAAVGRRAAALQ